MTEQERIEAVALAIHENAFKYDHPRLGIRHATFEEVLASEATWPTLKAQAEAAIRAADASRDEAPDPRLAGMRVLLQLALDELLHVVEAVDYQHATKTGVLKYTTPWEAITHARKLRDDLKVQATMWGLYEPALCEDCPPVGTNIPRRDDAGPGEAVQRDMGCRPMNEYIEACFDECGAFEAWHSAQAWCEARGISVGISSAGQPVGLMYGNVRIAKWRNLTEAERDALDGSIVGPRRHGPLTLRIRAAMESSQ
jgi:hypothetical protein